MLQKQVPKFLKMSTPMNLAARRRAAICNLGKELKVNGFPWSGRLGADNQFVLFVQVYGNEGHKANAVQRHLVQDLSHQAPNLLKLSAIMNLTWSHLQICKPKRPASDLGIPGLSATSLKRGRLFRHAAYSKAGHFL